LGRPFFWTTLLDDVETAWLGLEAVAGAGTLLALGEPGGEDHAVVGERGGGNPVLRNGFTKGGQHDRSGDPVVGGDREGVAGAVVEPGQDLGVGAWTTVRATVRATESVVGEVGLPGLVGHLGLEADVGGLGLLLRVWDHQPGLGQVARDRRLGDRDRVVVLEMPPDGVRSGVQAGGGQLLAQLEDQVDGLARRRGRDAVGTTGAGLEGGVARGPVAGEELEQPGLRDAVLGGDVGNGSALDHHGGDQQSVECHARTLEPGRRSVRDDSRHHSGMS